MRADRPRFTGRHAATGAIALIAAIALAACGGSSNKSTSKTASAPTTGTSSSAGAANRSKLESCLKAHGVTLPSFAGHGGFGGRPGFGASGRFGATGASGRFRRFGFGSSGRVGASGASGPRGFLGGNSKFAAAFRACGADFGGGFAGGGFARPGASSGGAFNAKSAADREAVDKYVSCVRSHGFDLPAPNFSGKGFVFNTSQFDTHSAKFIAASRTCQSLLNFGAAS